MASLDELKIDRSRRRYTWIAPLMGVIGVIAITGAGGLAAWRWWDASQVPTVRTAAVRQTVAGDQQPTVLNASGYVTARLQSTVSSKVTGRITEVLVEEGMEVREGQVLARLDDSTERARLALTEAQLQAQRGALAEMEVRYNEAILDLERQERLLEEGIVGRAEFDTARAEADSLRARIANQREQIIVAERQIHLQRTAIDDMVIRAPFSGVAISKDAQPGEMISPVSAGGGFTRTGICTLVDMSSLEIEVDVNESYIGRVEPEQRVVANLDAYPDWDIPASVITTIPAADRQRATVLVRIAFDELGDPRILPDMGVNVAFLEAGEPAAVADTDADAEPRLWIPANAVRNEGETTAIFLLRGDTVERRAVTLGIEDGADIEVLSGVTLSDQVVVEPPPALVDGDRVLAN
ncbi:MAG: efflux RND transporter periplasmic adaptor subunit [Acidobacteria bacterium]|nr:efflux RND transporter periplasmic adaptor subunit [Acidobacteriota bacterium]